LGRWPIASAALQPKISSACGDQRLMWMVEENSTTASGVFSMWLASSCRARSSMSCVRLSSLTSRAHEKTPITRPSASRCGSSVTEIHTGAPLGRRARRS
jgi:hypothetical protein